MTQKPMLRGKVGTRALLWALFLGFVISVSLFKRNIVHHQEKKFSDCRYENQVSSQGWGIRIPPVLCIRRLVELTTSAVEQFAAQDLL